MKKGDAAREAVKNKIIEAFGESFVAFEDKKIYVNAQDGPGGEMVQLAISMTIPKTPINKTDSSGVNSTEGAFPQVTSTQLSSEDQEAVADLLHRLNITT